MMHKEQFLHEQIQLTYKICSSFTAKNCTGDCVSTRDRLSISFLSWHLWNTNSARPSQSVHQWRVRTAECQSSVPGTVLWLRDGTSGKISVPFPSWPVRNFGFSQSGCPNHCVEKFWHLPITCTKQFCDLAHPTRVHWPAQNHAMWACKILVAHNLDLRVESMYPEMFSEHIFFEIHATKTCWESYFALTSLSVVRMMRPVETWARTFCPVPLHG